VRAVVGRQDSVRLGRVGEDAALSFVASLGWEVVARNLRTPYGEIDLLCRDRGCLVVVEVKARTGSRYGAPLEAIDARKVGRLLRSLNWWLAGHAPSGCPPVRVDVVGVELDVSGRPLWLRLDRDVLAAGV